MQTVVVRARSSNRDLFALLPRELRNEVFLFSRYQPEHDPPKLFVKWLRRNRGVSRGWRGDIDGLPLIWRNVNLDAHAKLIALQVKRARGIGLRVSCQLIEKKESAEKIHWLREHRDAIRDLDITVDILLDDKLAYIVSSIRFPNLEKFNVSAAYDFRRHRRQLDVFPDDFCKPSRLRHLSFLNMAVPVSTLQTHTHVLSLRLMYLNIYHPDTPLSDLRGVLQRLTCLSELALASRLLVTAKDRTQERIPLPSLRRLTFIGNMERFDDFLLAFDLPFVKSWHLELHGLFTKIESCNRLLSLVGVHSSLIRSAKLNCKTKTHSQLTVAGSDERISFKLVLDTTAAGPFEAIAVLLGADKVSMGAVKWVEFIASGSIFFLPNVDDDVVGRVLGAWTSVKEIKVSGNGNVWRRVPVVVRDVRRGLWKDLVRISMVCCDLEPTVLGDWVSLARERAKAQNGFRGFHIHRSMVTACSRQELDDYADMLRGFCGSVTGKFQTEDERYEFLCWG